jgi:ADP-ribose pyrophosphatase YjhB (NUDIX family)
MEGEVSRMNAPDQPVRRDWGGLPRNRAGGFIIRERDDTLEVLLMRRYRVERGEYFVIPGGSVEDGEDVRMAAMRELTEETNLGFKLGSLLYVSLNPRSRRIGHYFVAHWTGGQPQLGGPERDRANPANIYQPVWMRLEVISALPLFPSVIRDRLAHDLDNPPESPVQLEETD